jgi:hypothetical protein
VIRPHHATNAKANEIWDHDRLAEIHLLVCSVEKALSRKVSTIKLCAAMKQTFIILSRMQIVAIICSVPT